VKYDLLNKKKEVYVRNAQGNVVAVYEVRMGMLADSLFTKEFNIYGSERIGYLEERNFLGRKCKSPLCFSMPGGTGVVETIPGMVKGKKVGGMIPVPLPFPPSSGGVLPGKPWVASIYYGRKRYELTDWLGNVRVVVSDKKVADSVSGTTVLNYKPEVLSIRDYYAYGMGIQERTYNLNVYRFGFGGHERIEEIGGGGTIVDMGDRWLDTRLGRTFKVDSKWNLYPDISPYSYGGNNPVVFIDPDGRFLIDVHKRITRKALQGFSIEFEKGAPESSKQMMEAFKEGILGKNLLTGGVVLPDVEEFRDKTKYESEKHFDNMMTFDEIIENFKEIETNLTQDIYAFKNRSESENAFIAAMELGEKVGRYLHAIQDFYSHSNYVELYMKYYRETYGKKPKLRDLKGIPTLEEVLSDPAKYGGFIDILKRELRTGGYPSRKGDEYSHKKMNKDIGAGGIISAVLAIFSESSIIPTFKSRAAESVATRATEQFFKKVKRGIEE